MKVQYTNRSGRLTVEIDSETQTDLFMQLATFQEIFDESECA